MLFRSSDLIVRVKDDYDGAEPSGNSIATLALLKLAAITGREDFRQPAALAFMLHVLDFWLDEPRRVVIAGESNFTETKELLHAAHSVYQPNKIVLGNIGAVEPFAKTLSAKNETTAYICTGNTCQSPTDDVEILRQQLH